MTPLDVNGLIEAQLGGDSMVDSSGLDLVSIENKTTIYNMS